MEIYDLKTKSFVAGTALTAVTSTVPDVMVGVIVHAKYVSGVPTGTVYVKLMQQRLGTVTGTLDVVVLTPASPVYPTTHGRVDNIVAIVDPGHRVVAVCETGSVIGVVTYGYVPGRMSRP